MYAVICLQSCVHTFFFCFRLSTPPSDLPLPQFKPGMKFWWCLSLIRTQKVTARWKIPATSTWRWSNFFFLNSMQWFKTNEQLNKNATTDFLHIFPTTYGWNYAPEKNKNAQNPRYSQISQRSICLYFNVSQPSRYLTPVMAHNSRCFPLGLILQETSS